MAEWLRRLTRNQMGSSRVGSNPTRSGRFFNIGSQAMMIYFGKVITMGFEPTREDPI